MHRALVAPIGAGQSAWAIDHVIWEQGRLLNDGCGPAIRRRDLRQKVVSSLTFFCVAMTKREVVAQVGTTIRITNLVQERRRKRRRELARYDVGSGNDVAAEPVGPGRQRHSIVVPMFVNVAAGQ